MHLRLAPYYDTGLPVIQRLQLTAGLLCLASLHLRFVVSNCRPGLARLVLSLPVLALNVLAPFVYKVPEEILPRTSTVFILSWLCNFKVLALCLDRGPLARPWTWPQFMALMALPVFPQAEGTGSAPKGRLQDEAGTSAQLAFRWFSKLGLLGVIVFALTYYDLPKVVKHFVYGFGMYSFVGFLMDGPLTWLSQHIGLTIIPTYDQPWLSTSLADFWGRRWNVPTSSTLRVLVYDAVVDGQLISSHTSHKVSEVARALGTIATFFTSGVVHEYILWTIDLQGNWGWKWTFFFTLQGPLMVIETYMKRWARARKLQLPRWLSIVLTLAVLEAAAGPFFFTPVDTDRSTADMVVTACKKNYEAVLALVQSYVSI